jgi:quinol monooxygenase YgiN
MSTIPVVAIIRAKAGKEKALEELLKKIVAPTHEEPGCLRYALHKSQTDPRSFVFVER